MAKTTVKKRWYKLVAPKFFNEAMLGETPSIEAKAVIGKVIKVNMSTLTNDMKKQSTEVSFLVDSVEGDKARTSVIGMKLLPTSIKRMVRKGRTRLDQTVKAITKDEKVVTIKVLLITGNIVKGSVSSALQTETKRFLIKKITSTDYAGLSELVVSDKMQRELKEKLSKIYPVKMCDIKGFKLERFIKSLDVRKIKEMLAKESKRPVVVEEQEEPLEEETEEAEGKQEENSEEQETEEESSEEQESESEEKTE